MHVFKNGVFHLLQQLKHPFTSSVKSGEYTVYLCNCNLLCVTGVSCQAGPQVSHRGSTGKAIHLRTAQGIVGHCSDDKVRALQRVSTE